MISSRVCFLVALTFASIELKHSDATLVDLLNDVKNKLEEIKEDVQDVDETVKLVLHHVAGETSDNNGTLGMEETVFVGGDPGASSEWSSICPKADAFKLVPAEKCGGWKSEFDKDDKPPVYIWYDFKRQLRPAKISYLPQKYSVDNANAFSKAVSIRRH